MFVQHRNGRDIFNELRSDEKSVRQLLWGILDQLCSYDNIDSAAIGVLQTPENQVPELRIMLEEGFIRANGNWKRPDTFAQAKLVRRCLDRRLLDKSPEISNFIDIAQIKEAT